MSIFDPQHLYVHHQKKTHKGQIIQKRPTNLEFAASQQDFQKAVKIIQTYGYQIARSLGFAYAFYSGTVETNYFDYKSIFNSTVRQKLLDVNPNIFSNTFNLARIIINLECARFDFNPASGTFTIQVLNSTYSNSTDGDITLLPYNSMRLIVYHGTSSHVFNRPATETWNNGIYVENITDPNYYLSFVYNDYTNIPSTNIAIMSGTNLHYSYWTYSVTVIVN